MDKSMEVGNLGTGLVNKQFRFFVEYSRNRGKAKHSLFGDRSQRNLNVGMINLYFTE